MKKKKTIFFLFTHCVSLIIFSYSLYFSPLLLAHSLMHSSSLAEWPLPFASFFSSFLPTCLTSLTSHIHLCGLTFVRPFINVTGLLYIIIEEKMNPILLFWTNYSSKPISLCWLLSTCPTSSFNELRQCVGWNMVQRTQHLLSRRIIILPNQYDLLRSAHILSSIAEELAHCIVILMW